MAFVRNFFTQILLQTYLLTGNLGVAIITLTILLRAMMVPLSVGTIKSQKKMQDLKPELDKLKAKHKDDKQAFNTAQMELYKKYNINPLAGCLPYLLQFALLILIYNVLNTFIHSPEVNGIVINSTFLWLDLRTPDPMFILPILAGGSQLILSLMIAPAAEIPDKVPNDSKSKKVQEANKKEEGMAEMASTMQKQMIFMLPLMTGFFATRFPSGLALYWIVTTVFSIAQQYFISGPGGLMSYTKLAQFKLSSLLKK